MLTQPPEELKSLRPFLRRGDQLEKSGKYPVIAYYCLFAAVKLALDKNLHIASPECTTFVTSLMDDLERRKAALQGNDLLEDDLAAHAYVEEFALQVFNNGTKAIENRNVTAKTADTLEAASVFFELLKTFNSNLDLEILQKIKYSKYHAARILKAIKEGIDLNPPLSPPDTTPSAPTAEEIPEDEEGFRPPVEDTLHRPEELDQATLPDTIQRPPFLETNDIDPSATLSEGYFPSVPDLHKIEVVDPTSVDTTDEVSPYSHNAFPTPSAPDANNMSNEFHSPTPRLPERSTVLPTFQRSKHPPVSPELEPVPRKAVSEKDIMKAQKNAKWAISALDYEDIDTAIAQFKNGLRALGAL